MQVVHAEGGSYIHARYTHAYLIPHMKYFVVYIHTYTNIRIHIYIYTQNYTLPGASTYTRTYTCTRVCSLRLSRPYIIHHLDSVLGEGLDRVRDGVLRPCNGKTVPRHDYHLTNKTNTKHNKITKTKQKQNSGYNIPSVHKTNIDDACGSGLQLLAIITW